MRLVYTRRLLHTHTHTHTHTHIHTCTHSRTHARKHARTHARMHAHGPERNGQRSRWWIRIRSLMLRVMQTVWWVMHQTVECSVTAVARKRFRSFCQENRWQVTAKDACILHMCLRTKWGGMVHDCMGYTERAETASVSRSTRHITTKQLCKYTTSADIQNALLKSDRYSFRITCDKSALSLLENGK